MSENMIRTIKRGLTVGLKSLLAPKRIKKIAVIVLAFSLFLQFPILAALNTASLSVIAANSEYVSVADASQVDLDLSTALTIEGWFYFNSFPGDNANMGLVCKYGADANRAYCFQLRRAAVDGAGIYRLRFFAVNSAGGEDVLFVSWSPSTTTWYHLAVSWLGSSKTAKFYVDGVQQGSDQVGSSVDTLRNGAADFEIGRYNDGAASAYFNGLIDEVRIWGDVRTVNEINDNKSLVLTGETDELAYWSFDNTPNDTCGASCGNVNTNNLTANNYGTIYSTTVPFPGTADAATTKSEELLLEQELIE